MMMMMIIIFILPNPPYLLHLMQMMLNHDTACHQTSTLMSAQS